MDFAAKERFNIAVLFGKGDGVIHIGADAGEAFEIAVDEPLRLGPRDAQVTGEAKARDAVDHTKVDRLGLTANIRGHLVQRHIEHLGRCHCVDVVAVAEGLFQGFDPCHMRQNAQFDLAIVE